MFFRDSLGHGSIQQFIEESSHIPKVVRLTRNEAEPRRDLYLIFVPHPIHKRSGLGLISIAPLGLGMLLET